MDAFTGLNPPQDIEKAHQCVTPTHCKIDLHDAHAVRRELGSVYRDMRAGSIKISDGTRLAYVLDLLRKSCETAVLQSKLELIEQTLKLRTATK